MKKYVYYLVLPFSLLLGGLQGKGQISADGIYTSSSPIKFPGTGYKIMMFLDYSTLFTLTPDLSGGIIGTINSGGKITLKVYAYDDTKPDGKGAVVYGVEKTTSSTTYAGDTWNIVNTDIWNYNVSRSSDIKALCQQASLYGPDGCKSYLSIYNALAAGARFIYLGRDLPKECVEFYTAEQPVIVEATISNATLNKIKVPGMGEFEASQLFQSTQSFMGLNRGVVLGSHRGDWQDVNAPENTKRSVQDMISENYDMLELDLWSTIDDSIVVFHDMGLNKRTTQTGSLKARTWSSLQGLYIKNRFEELIQTPNTQISLLGDMLDYIKQQDPQGKIRLNLDRSANDVNFFKKVYKIVNDKGMLARTIFKGRYSPDPAPTGEVLPTWFNILTAFKEMYPTLSFEQVKNKMKAMHFTPILFDNKKDGNTTNDAAFADTVKAYVDGMIDAGIADGFELNFKSYPVGSADFANVDNSNVFLLQQWAVLGDGSHPTRNFVEYIHSKGLPVGIFASVPEVAAIPDYKPDGTRNTDSLVSGFIKEDVTTFVPYVKDQGTFDFRGDWEFYIGAGVDYVITDRPDALRVYLNAIGKLYH